MAHKQLRIGVDLDGVVYDFADSFRRYLIGEGYRSSDLPDPWKWNTWECWGMSQEEWLDHFSAGVEAGVIFGTGEPFPGAVEALQRLWNSYHDIHIVTHRTVHPDAIGWTAKWLAEHDIPHTSLTFAKDKTVVPVDVFIEDNVENAFALSAAGTEAVLMDRPWNRVAPGIRRVYSWAEFESFVGNI